MKHLTIILLTTLALFSCSKEKNEQTIIEDKIFLNENNMLSLKRHFPNMYNGLSFKNIQIGRVEANPLARSASDSLVTLPVIDNNKVIGRYFEHLSNGFLLDFTNYQSEVTVYDVSSGELIAVYHAVFDEETNSYRYEISTDARINWRYSACVAFCGVQGLVVAGVDGPSPAMDALAIAYLVACSADCAANHL
jgi:hypothetical protein